MKVALTMSTLSSILERIHKAILDKKVYYDQRKFQVTVEMTKVSGMILPNQNVYTKSLNGWSC